MKGEDRFLDLEEDVKGMKERTGSRNGSGVNGDKSWRVRLRWL